MKIRIFKTHECWALHTVEKEINRYISYIKLDEKNIINIQIQIVPHEGYVGFLTYKDFEDDIEVTKVLENDSGQS